MSTRIRLLVSASLLSGCVQPAPPQAEPVSLRSTRSKADVVQVATRELTSVGFQISASDTAAGTLTAKRERPKRENFDYVTCKFAENSLAELNLVSTLTVTVSATGSNVDIRSSVLSAYPDLESSALSRSESQTDCASNGVIEKKVAAALAKP